MPRDLNIIDSEIPEWIYKSISSKLDNPGSLDKKNISLQKSFNPLSSKSQITAFANAGKSDSALIVFEDFDGIYHEIFSAKLKLILSVQIRHPNIIVVCMDESGTGTATCNFYIFRYTGTGYRAVWQGLSNYNKNNCYPQINFEVTAGINFSCDGELSHSILRKLYRQGNSTNPENVEKFCDIYSYDEDKMSYKFIKRF